MQPVCFYCGDVEVLPHNEVITDLQKQISIVRPICKVCNEAGHIPNFQDQNCLADTSEQGPKVTEPKVEVDKKDQTVLTLSNCLDIHVHQCS